MGDEVARRGEEGAKEERRRGGGDEVLERLETTDATARLDDPTRHEEE